MPRALRTLPARCRALRRSWSMPSGPARSRSSCRACPTWPRPPRVARTAWACAAPPTRWPMRCCRPALHPVMAPNSAATCAAVVGLMRPKRLALGAARPWMPRAAQATSSAWATGCAGQRRPMVACPPAAASATPAWRGRMSVSGPGQKASTSFCAKPGTLLAKCAMPAALATCTMSGWSLGRPLALKICATATSLLALAASPYTVSVGSPSNWPLRTARAAVAMAAAVLPFRIMVRTARCPARRRPGALWRGLLRAWRR